MLCLSEETAQTPGKCLHPDSEPLSPGDAWATVFDSAPVANAWQGISQGQVKAQGNSPEAALGALAAQATAGGLLLSLSQEFPRSHFPFIYQPS